MSGDTWEGVYTDSQGFESTNMRDDRSKRVGNTFGPPELDVGAGLVGASKVEPGPQLGKRRECVPPVTAYVGQCDKILPRATIAVAARDE